MCQPSLSKLNSGFYGAEMVLQAEEGIASYYLRLLA